MEEFPFEPLAREVIEELEPIAQAGGLELCLEVPSAATAWSDRMRLRQVLLNLISNAIKFTPSGGRAWLRASSGPDGLHIEVSDTGVGMAANQLQRIFDEFVQIEEGTTRRHDGTGLGLALSRRLADLMGGRLTVTSSVGQGSTFRLALPAVPVG
jgi:signal transduction histidine kinase